MGFVFWIATDDFGTELGEESLEFDLSFLGGTELCSTAFLAEENRWRRWGRCWSRRRCDDGGGVVVVFVFRGSSRRRCVRIFGGEFLANFSHVVGQESLDRNRGVGQNVEGVGMEGPFPNALLDDDTANRVAAASVHDGTELGDRAPVSAALIAQRGATPGGRTKTLGRFPLDD